MFCYEQYITIYIPEITVNIFCLHQWHSWLKTCGTIYSNMFWWFDSFGNTETINSNGRYVTFQTVNGGRCWKNVFFLLSRQYVVWRYGVPWSINSRTSWTSVERQKNIIVHVDVPKKLCTAPSSSPMWVLKIFNEQMKHDKIKNRKHGHLDVLYTVSSRGSVEFPA